MNTFPKDPLKKMISAIYSYEHKTNMVEKPIFMLILAVFITGLIASQLEFTGMIVDKSVPEHLYLNKTFNETSTLTLVLKGNITSLMVEGELVGSGEGRILLGDKVVYDSGKKSGNSIVTGHVIGDDTSPNADNSSNISQEEPGYENRILIDDGIAKVDNSVNSTLNETQEEIITPEKEQEIIGRKPDEPLNNLSDDISAEFINESFAPGSNQTIFPRPTELLRKFSAACEETCILENIGSEVTLTIMLDNSTLYLDSIAYTYVKIKPDENEAINESVLNGTIETIPVNLSNISINESEMLQVNSSQFNDSYTYVETDRPVLWTRIIDTKLTNETSLPADAFSLAADEISLVMVGGKEMNLAEFNDIADYRRLKNEIKELERPMHKEKASSVFEKLKDLNRKLSELKTKDTVLYDDVTVRLIPKNEIAQLKYYLPGPKKEELEITSFKKIITVSSETHYENVVTSTEISESRKENINLYWVKENEKQLFGDAIYLDTNENGLIDKLQWTIPHLSNQTFEVSITVLNPYTYLRDDETWTVAFNTTGVGNLTISSPNAGWTEFLTDDQGTFDEMRFLDLRCGDISLKDDLKLIGFDSTTYLYNNLEETGSIDIEKLSIENYECNETVYLSNYMIRAGYATLLFEFSGQNNTVTDYAYDPISGWCYQESANVSTSCGGQSTGNYVNEFTGNSWFDGDWETYSSTSLKAGYINYTKPSRSKSSSLWMVKPNIIGSGIANLSISYACWNYSETKLMFKVYTDGPPGLTYTGMYCYNGSWEELLYTTSIAQMYEEAMWWDLSDNVLIQSFNFSNTVNNTAYGHSNDSLTVTTVSTNDFASTLNPTGAEGWDGYNFTSAGYSALASNDGVYANISYGGSLTNKEQFGRFNLSLGIAPVYYNWLYVAADVKYVGNIGTSETCHFWVYNFTQVDWMNISGTVSASDTLMERNFTGGFGDIVKNNQIVLMVEASNADNKEGCLIDFVEARASYYNNSLPYFTSNPAITPTDPGPSSNLTCTFESTDGDSDRVINVTNWVRNGKSIAVINMPFEGNDRPELNATDYSGYGNHGTVFGGAIWDRNGGKIGGAYNFSDASTQYIGIPHSDSLNITQALTFESWMRLKTNGSSTQYKRPFDKINGNYGYSLQIDPVGDLSFVIGNSVATDSESHALSPWTIGQWYHIALTYDVSSDLLRWYVNGVNVENDTHETVFSIVNDNTVFEIGQYLNGTLDDFRLYNITLSDKQIYQDYLAGLSGKEPTLIVYNDTRLNDQWYCSVTPNDGYSDGTAVNSASALISLSTAQDFTSLSILPSNGNTSSNLSCYATSVDGNNASFTVEWYWYNSSTLKFSGNTTGVVNNTNTLIATVGAGNTTRFESWVCTVRSYDGSTYSAFNSTSLNITDEPPTHSLPSVSPSLPNITSNLTCSANNILDTDNDMVNNITNWYKNNVSTTVLYMPFEGVNGYESTKAIDYSGYGNNGTVVGAIWNRTGGKMGGRYVFDSLNDYYISVEDDPSLRGMAELTIETWVYTNSTYTWWPRIIEKGSNSSGDTNITYSMNVDPTGQLLHFYMETTGGTASVYGDSALPTNRWNHLVARYTGSRVEIFINGALQSDYSTLTGNVANYSGNNNLNIGIDAYPSWSDTWNGSIDEVKIYNSALTTEQINLSYLAGLSNKTSDTIVKQELTEADQWTCSVTPNDGYLDGANKNSTVATVFSSTPPTHDTPTITPTIPSPTNNLTCNWNNVQDSEGDPVLNITNWYKNNKSNTILYLPFEGGSTSSYTKDYSGYGNNGYVSGPAWNMTGGMLGGAYVFTAGSAQSIQILEPNMYVFNTDNSFSLETWVKAKSVSSNAGIIYKNDWIGPAARGYRLWINGGDFTFSIGNGTDEHDARTVADNAVWRHIVAKYNSTSRQMSIYKNGVLKDNLTAPIGNITNGRILTIGNSPDLDYDFNGTIDEVKIYNYSLSDAQIAANYQAGLAGHNPQIMVSNEIALGDQWLCSVTPNDGYADGSTKNSTIVTVQNTAPTHDNPYITPFSPNITSNLTCNWNSVVDSDGDAVVNITNWYKNNVSTTMLYMPFEGNGRESTNATDYSGYGNNGTVFSAIWNRTGGKIGGAYTINGSSSYIEIPDRDYFSPNITRALSVEAWVYMNTDPAATWYLVSKGSGSNYEWDMRFHSDNTFNAYISTPSGTDIMSCQEWTALNVGVWYHLAFTLDMDAPSLRCYVNATLGDQVGSSNPNAMGNKSASLRIGRKADGSGQSNITIDEIKIFNSTLSPEQIAADYQAGLAGRVSNIIVRNETGANNQWICSVTPNDGYQNGITKNSTTVQIGNLVPEIVSISLYPAIANTSSNIQCNATISDDAATTTVEYIWYNSGSFALGGNLTNVQNGTNTLISTLGSGNTTRGDTWNCTIRAFDGVSYGSRSSSTIVILNEVPTQGTPFILPVYPNITNNLTCFAQSVSDSDSDAIANITSWYKNNLSVELLYMPFEGGSNATYTKDYSGYANDGRVVNGNWSSSIGKTGGGYRLNNDSYINMSNNTRYDLTGNFTIGFWMKKAATYPGTFERLIHNYWSANNNYMIVSTGPEVTVLITSGGTEYKNQTIGLDGDVWYHFALVWNNKSRAMKIYVNGTDVTLPSSNSVNLDTQESLLIAANPTLSKKFMGTLDEVKIYNFSLSPEQINAEYRAGLSSLRPNTIVSNETALNDQWICAMTPNDGYANGQTVNSTVKTISNQDSIAPGCAISSITEVSNDAYQYISGTTIYYTNINTGSFNVSVSANDSDTGISNVTFPTTVSAGSVDAASPYTLTYSWDTSDTYDASATVTCYDNTGNTNTTSFNVNLDAAPPSGGSVSYADGYSSNAQITFSDGSDSEAGLNASKTRLLRRSASMLSNNSCGSYGSWSQTGSLDPTSPYTDSLTGGNCYQYMYEVFDYIENGVNYTSSNILKYNNLPTHDTPTVTPSLPNTSSNLTCNWNSVSDADSHAVVNITAWYKNNVSTTALYMPFEGNGKENTNSTDYSGYGNNGTVFGATFNRTGGKIGGAYVFDGTNDYIGIPDAANLDPPNNMTMEVWIKLNQLASNKGSQMRIIWKTHSVSPWESYELDINSADRLDITWSNSTGSNLFAGTENNVINLTNTWYHIVAVKYGPYFNFFVNGINRSSWSSYMTGTMIDSNGILTIGSAQGTTSFFNGTIDEVKIYNSSLSATQIISNYNAGLSNRTSNVILSSESILNDQWLCSVTPNDGYQDGTTKNSTAVTISSTNTAPSVSAISFSPTAPNTSSNIQCNATVADTEQSTVTVEYWWYNSSTFMLGGNTTSVTVGANSVISTLGSGNTSHFELWNCTMRANDGTLTSSFNSTTANISNLAATQSAPSITPALPNTTSNLMCNWNNIVDLDGDPVVNITNWYKNNKSTTVLYLPFEGNGGRELNSTTDYSGYGNNGTVTGPRWNRTAGKIGGGYSFDNTNGSFISIPDNSIYEIASNISVEAWIYWPGPANLSSGDSILHKDGGYGEGYRVIINEGLSTLIWQTGDSGVKDVSSDPLSPNQWYHIVTTYDGSIKNVYINGNLNKTGTKTGPLTFSSGNLEIGRGQSGGDTYPFNGTIDEIKIYNFTLSADQVNSNYNYGVLGKNSNAIVRNETALNDQWFCSVTPNDGYQDGTAINSSAVTVTYTNLGPSIYSISLIPITANTSSTLSCNATLIDDFNATLNVQFWWYNNSIFVTGGNATASNNTNTVISTIANTYTTRFDIWNCTILASDGNVSSSYSSSIINISDEPPTHNAPSITPSNADPTSNLTCNWNNVNDSDNEDVHNITNWYRNNRSTTVLNLPFEGVNGMESSIAIDYSGSGNNGTVNGAAWNRTGGRVGGAYVFDGVSDSITVTANPSLNLSIFTLSYWFKLDQIPSNKGVAEGLIYGAYGSGYSQGWRNIISNSNDKLYFQINFGGAAPAAILSSALVAGRWYHVAASYNGTTAKLYMNGTLVGSVQNSSGINYASSGTLNIGYAQGYLNGTMDEVRLYNYSLSDSQVYQIYLEENQSKNSQVMLGNELNVGEGWICTVTPNDGYQDGTTKNSTAVNISSTNTAPTISAISFSPAAPNTSSNIQCNATITDAEQSTVTVEYWWYNNSVLKLSGNTTSVAVNTNTVISTLGLGNTTMGELWNCTVRATDGQIFSNYNSTTVIISNEPPIIASARISPTSPNPGDTLKGYCNATDSDNNTLEYNYRWYHDGILNQSGQYGVVAGLGWRFQETANSTFCNGGWDATNSCSKTYDASYATYGIFDSSLYGAVYFNYSKPFGASNLSRWQIKSHDGLANLTIPQSCWSQNTLQFYATSWYDDWYGESHDDWACYNGATWTNMASYGWSEVYEEGMWWYVAENSTRQGVETNLANISGAWTVTGGTWTFECSASDGNSSTTWANATVSVQGSSPTISVPTFNPASPNTSSNIECKAIAIDGENTTLNVEYFWYNSSVLKFSGNRTGVVNGTNTVISTLGSGNTTKGENWNCTVRAFDGTTYSSYSGSIVSISNAAPVIRSSRISPANPINTDDLLGYCNATDDDNDILEYNYVWYNNQVLNNSGTYGFVTGAGWLFQENPNATLCGSTWDPSYPCSNMYDGNYGTFGAPDSSNYAVVYFNYSKLPYSSNLSRWLIMDGVNQNTTIPEACWSQSTLMFKVEMSYDDWYGEYTGTYSCNNGAGWTVINVGGNVLYEEGMWWYLPVNGTNQGVETNIRNISNLNTTTGANWTFSCQASDGTISSSWLNSSVANIQNSAPTQNNPSITPALPNTTSNLTCNWNNVVDADGDAVVNITNWYKNNSSITLLNMPFEGNGNEAKNTTDYSGYGNNGTVFGAAWNMTGGKIGGAYQFDGVDDYVDARSANSLDNIFDGGGTFSAWVKLNTFGEGAGGYGRIFDKQDTSTSVFVCGPSAANCNLNSFELMMTTGTPGRWSSPANSINTGSWYYLVVTYDSSDYNNDPKLYINGTSVTVTESTTPSGSFWGDEAGNFLIGSNSATDRSFNGTIDEIKVYDMILSPEQIASEYQAGLASRASNVMIQNETSLSEQWLCSVTPNDGYLDGQTKNSTAVSISSANTAPGVPTLLSPSNGNTTVWTNPPTLIWQNVTDADNDAFNFSVNITSPVCPNIGIYNNISALNFTPPELMLDCVYFWQVLSSDGQSNSSWSEKWNFTVQSMVILTMKNSSVDFGTVPISSVSDTDSNVSPLVVRNDGNMNANITYVSINQSIWTSVSDNTEYLQYKADNDSTEAGSFNWTNSTTAWTNLTTIENINRTIIGFLKYQDANDEAEIDIRILVPPGESPGQRKSTIYVIGQSS